MLHAAVLNLGSYRYQILILRLAQIALICFRSFILIPSAVRFYVNVDSMPVAAISIVLCSKNQLRYKRVQ